MFGLIGILTILYIALRLVYKKNTSLNHRKPFNIKPYKRENKKNESIYKNR